MKIIGMDPSVTHFGVIEIGSTQEGLRPLASAVFKTKSGVVGNESKADEVTRRMKYLFRNVVDFCEKGGKPDVLCVEAPIIRGRFDSRLAIARLNRVRGVVDAMAVFWDIPVLEIMPAEALRIMTGSTKNEKDKTIMRAAVEAAMPGIVSIYPANERDVEHVCDAAGTAIACLRRGMQRMLEE